MSKILVTGGAGYIGSHTIRSLQKNGHSIVIFDNLSSGHRKAIEGFTLFKGDLLNKKQVSEAFEKYKPDAVVHFAGSIEAGESMTDPKRFYWNNVVAGLNLVDIMVEKNVKKMVFSSSAAVYGEPQKVPITEKDQTIPTNTYGQTKLMFEQILDAYDYAYGLKTIALRYFNAAGADKSGNIGADHKNKTHLITLLMLVALGQKDSIKIFGTDYPTPDGTCIRDYVHVSDLAHAHVLALNFLEKNNKSEKFNLGNDKGNSVFEVVEAAKEITGINLKVIKEERRPGDPAKLVASSRKAKNILGWEPQQDNIEAIVQTAWKWHLKNPQGYSA